MIISSSRRSAVVGCGQRRAVEDSWKAAVVLYAPSRVMECFRRAMVGLQRAAMVRGGQLKSIEGFGNGL